MALKKSADQGTGPLGHLPWTVSGLAGFAIEAVVWTFALRYLEISVAYPMASLSFVMVLFLSRLCLSEKVNKTRFAGVLLIIGGTCLVGLN
jgi:undecaprenyl phosphate-alpha-L-ara4N flippase subunit ArnE